MLLKPTESYFIRYLNYHVDPAPYLYIIYSDRSYTTGFNLHYLPNIRFRIPIDRYKRVNEKKWQEAYLNMRKAGYFRNFLKTLDEAKEKGYSRSRMTALTLLVERKHPWAMEAFRRYHTSDIRIRTI